MEDVETSTEGAANEAATETTDTQVDTSTESTDGGADAGGDTGGDAGAGAEGEAAPTEAGAAGAEGATGAAGAAAAAPYKPNFKFKVHDKEHEIPEWARSALKDAKSEKEVREIFEKAYGLDPVKNRAQRFKEKAETLEKTHTEFVEKQYAPLVSTLQEAKHYLESPNPVDFDNFLDVMGIPPEKVLTWAVHKAKYLEMPPEQKLQVDNMRAASRQARVAQTQNQRLMTQNEQQAVQARTERLATVLEKPEVKTVAAAYDEILGEPGAFQAEVIRHAREVYMTTRKDISVDEAVEKVLARAGKFVALKGQTTTTGGAAGAGAAGAGNANPSVNPPTRKNVPTIPNISGNSGASPARKVPTSTDDLRKMRKERMSAQT